MPHCGEPFKVERQGRFRWALYAMNKYSGVRVAVFWTRRGAECAAEKLNKFMRERPEVEKREEEYEKSLKFARITAAPLNTAISFIPRQM